MLMLLRRSAMSWSFGSFQILFGHAFDEAAYARALAVCDMADDIKSLADGDRTEIGERGINLSGGQKQRVSLCRAVYANADVLLMDDVLSAVDSHVGHHIMHECILKELAGKTRVLVLHQMQWIHHADYVIIMDEGRIADCGSYSELKARGVDFDRYVNKKVEEEAVLDATAETEKESEKGPEQEEEKEKEPDGGKEADSEKGRLTTAEDRQVGTVRLHVWLAYFRAIGLPKVLLMLVCLGGHQVFRVSSAFWMARWSEDATAASSEGRQPLHSVAFYLGFYSLLNGGECNSFSFSAFRCVLTVLIALFSLPLTKRVAITGQFFCALGRHITKAFAQVIFMMDLPSSSFWMMTNMDGVGP